MKMKKTDRSSTQSAGFSLLEVMMALFIVALVIAAVSKVALNSTRNARLMKESTLAHWVALNELDRYQIDLALGKAGGASEGEEEMGNMSWHWVREVKPSSSSDLMEVKVSVYHIDDRSEEEAVATAKAYVPAQ